MDAHRSPIARGVEVVAVLEAVDFEQIAARDVVVFTQRVVLLGDVYAVRAHVYLVANLVSAHIDVVEHEVDELGGRIELERREGSQGRGDGVAHHRLVAGIGQQRPLLGLSVAFAQKLLFLLELDFVGLFRHIPGGVAATAYGDGVITGQQVILVDVVQAAVLVDFLARDASPVERLDIDGGQVGHPRVLRTEG